MLLLGGCEDGEPRINETPRLISPLTTFLVDISGVSDLSGLEVRVTGTAVRAVLEDRVSAEDEGDAVWFNDEVIAVTAVEEGTASVELLHESQRVGVVEFTVRNVDRVVVSQPDGRDAEPPVDAEELRFVTAGAHGATAFFTLTALDTEGRKFDGAREIVGEVVSDDPNTTIVEQQSFFGQTLFALDFATAGSHHLDLLSEAGDFAFELEAVSPDDVASLRIDRSDSGDAYFVYGLTADGTLVINLNPEFTVAGEPRESNGFGSHILIDYDEPEDGTVQVTWNGLTATR